MENTKDGYPVVHNRPISCRNCGTAVQGRITQIRRPDQTIREEVKWICGKCGSLVKVGTLAS